jgi:hypothetical protein
MREKQLEDFICSVAATAPRLSLSHAEASEAFDVIRLASAPAQVTLITLITLLTLLTLLTIIILLTLTLITLCSGAGLE